jgi:hypothetical protein
VVTDYLELSANEIHEFISIRVKAGGCLSIVAYGGEDVESPESQPHLSKGCLSLKIHEYLVVEEGGEINVIGKGYRGGVNTLIEYHDSYLQSTMMMCDPLLTFGESADGKMGGFCGESNQRYGSIGGSGGSNATPGKAPAPNTFHGQYTFSQNRASTLTTLLGADLRMGAGGGAGGSYYETLGGNGGNGGGVIRIKSKEIRNFGRIVADGADGLDGLVATSFMDDTDNNEGAREVIVGVSSGGGGGGGGSIYLEAEILYNFGQISAKGGKGGDITSAIQEPDFVGFASNGGDGGDGVIVIHTPEDFHTELKATTSPTAAFLLCKA